MNLDRSSLIYRIIIASCLSSFVVGYLCCQDLEEVNIRTRTPSKNVKIDSTIVTDAPATQATIREVTDHTTMTVDERDPDTYRKQAYIHTMVRQTYYHRLTTSPWSRLLKPKGWSENVGKWRYWSHLRSYLIGNDQNIIILREPEERISIGTQPTAVISEIEASTLKEIDTSSPSPLGDILESSTPVVSTDLGTEGKEVVLEEDSLVIPSEKNPVYVVVTKAPWLKEDTYYENKEITDSVTIDEIPAEKPILVNEVTEEAVREPQPPIAKVQAPSKPREEPITQQTPTEETITRTIPKAVETITPPSTPTFSSSLAPAAFASLRGNVPWPVSGRITDRFGTRENPEARGLSPENYGIDMLCPAGTAVKAVHSGTVLLARRQSPYDVIVTIKHGDYTSAYYYLITPYVKQGDIVQAGQTIGQLRTSVDEADFHFEIWYNQERLNPELWLK